MVKKYTSSANKRVRNKRTTKRIVHKRSGVGKQRFGGQVDNFNITLHLQIIHNIVVLDFIFDKKLPWDIRYNILFYCVQHYYDRIIPKRFYKKINNNQTSNQIKESYIKVFTDFIWSLTNQDITTTSNTGDDNVKLRLRFGSSYVEGWLYNTTDKKLNSISYSLINNDLITSIIKHSITPSITQQPQEELTIISQSDNLKIFNIVNEIITNMTKPLDIPLLCPRRFKSKSTTTCPILQFTRHINPPKNQSDALVKVVTTPENTSKKNTPLPTILEGEESEEGNPEPNQQIKNQQPENATLALNSP
jgi:hypothetical protein